MTQQISFMRDIVPAVDQLCALGVNRQHAVWVVLRSFANDEEARDAGHTPRANDDH